MILRMHLRHWRRIMRCLYRLSERKKKPKTLDGVTESEKGREKSTK